MYPTQYENVAQSFLVVLNSFITKYQEAHRSLLAAVETGDYILVAIRLKRIVAYHYLYRKSIVLKEHLLSTNSNIIEKLDDVITEIYSETGTGDIGELYPSEYMYSITQETKSFLSLLEAFLQRFKELSK